MSAAGVPRDSGEADAAGRHRAIRRGRRRGAGVLALQMQRGRGMTRRCKSVRCVTHENRRASAADDSTATDRRSTP